MNFMHNLNIYKAMFLFFQVHLNSQEFMYQNVYELKYYNTI